MEKKLNYKIRLANIKNFVFDVDGVLSDGKVLLESSGAATRNTHVRDSLAIRLAANAGYRVVVITAGRSELVEKRMYDVGAEKVFLGVFSKFPVLNEYVESEKLKWSETLYMGDDLPDYECLLHAGVSTAPSDAVADIRALVDYVSHVKGGDGCARDVIEQVMRLHGKWPLLKENPRISV